MVLKYLLSSPKIGFSLISGLGINISWLYLMPWSWNTALTLAMIVYLLKLRYNRFTIKNYIAYDLGLMGSSCLAFVGLNFLLQDTLAAPMVAVIIFNLWSWIAITMLFNRIVPLAIRHEFALGYKPN